MCIRDSSSIDLQYNEIRAVTNVGQDADILYGLTPVVDRNLVVSAVVMVPHEDKRVPLRGGENIDRAASAQRPLSRSYTSRVQSVSQSVYYIPISI